jgi:hypothetical protein
VKPAATPFTFTALTSVNPEPAIVTSAPAAALAGANEFSFGSTLNVAALRPVPPGFVTPICPVRAPAGTPAFTCVADTVVGAVATPPKLTAVAEAMFVPFIVTTAPTAPEAGEKLDTVGAGTVTVKSEALAPVPPGVVTAIGPVVAPAGTFAVTCVAESAVNVVALVPLNVTAEAPVRCVPVIVTLVPTGPLGGENPSTVGAGTSTSKLAALSAVPFGVVTEIFPSGAPAGTVAVMSFESSTVNEALVPLNRTAVAPSKFEPVIPTLVPASPLDGVKPSIVGDDRSQDGNLKLPIRVCQPRSLVDGKYSFAYQKVHSSEGSTFMVL